MNITLTHNCLSYVSLNCHNKCPRFGYSMMIDGYRCYSCYLDSLLVILSHMAIDDYDSAAVASVDIESFDSFART